MTQTSVTLALWVTPSPRNTGNLSWIPGTDIYIVVSMTIQNGGPLCFGPIPSDLLKNPQDIEKMVMPESLSFS